MNKIRIKKPKTQKINPNKIAKALGADRVCKITNQNGWLGSMAAYEEIKNMKAIIGTQRQYVEIESMGYQFPQILDDSNVWDLNWLNIKIKVTTPSLKWEKTDPALDTSDLEKMADWFKTGRTKKLWFTQPCLEIHRLPKKGKLYQFDFIFGYKFKPTDKSVTIRIEATKDQVDRFVVGLRNELKKFPFRHVPEKRNIAKEIMKGFEDLKAHREGKIKLKTTVIKK